MTLPERANYSLTEIALSPFPAEPAHEFQIANSLLSVTYWTRFVLGNKPAGKNASTNLSCARRSARAWVTGSWRGQYDWSRIAQWRLVTESRILRAETFLQIDCCRSDNRRGGPGTDWRI
jgi:hypothetical protein